MREIHTCVCLLKLVHPNTRYTINIERTKRWIFIQVDWKGIIIDIEIF